MQSLAMRPFVDDLGLSDLVQHWLAVEEAIRQGARAGLRQHPVAMLSLEGFARNPRWTMHALLVWLKLEFTCNFGRFGCAAVEGGLPRVLDIDDSAMGLEHPGPSGPFDCGVELDEYFEDLYLSANLPDFTTWSDLPQADAWLRTVERYPNSKYAKQYADEIAGSVYARERHEALVAEYGQRVYEVSGYRLGNDFHGQSFNEPPDRGTVWWREWCGV